jgi:peptide methionine sulfoxide reductase msrA/msrB
MQVLAKCVAVAAIAAAGCSSTPATSESSTAQRKASPEMTDKKLSAEEERVIVHKGTEAAFSGRFVGHKADGTYACKRCGAQLFSSSSKFDSGCGWPSFERALPGAVREQVDADGRRTEIVCAACGGHLGHVFRGEGLTAEDTRHCVNSVSLDFTAKAVGEARAIFAGGCFWGVEHLLSPLPGVAAVRSGYIGGDIDNPTYEQVCSGRSGHAEAVEVVYDPSVVTYEELARLFFEIHDPTQRDRQGPDQGHQYRSAVFYLDDEQRAVADKLIGILRGKGYDVATEVVPATKFWPADDYHQDYYQRKGTAPYCHARVERF